LKNWRQKLGALLVAAVIWYLIKMHLKRRGRIPQVYDFVPGQVMGDPVRDAPGPGDIPPHPG
ncbi:MAG: hypothetical protein GWO24_19795, partial [Akkermansiaceae bacterium]|nr:hypothetical protein [Akkermansiaceae bacterium]